MEQIEAMGGRCLEITFDGRSADIQGTVPDTTIIDSLNRRLLRIPGIRFISARFGFHEDSLKMERMRQLSNRHIYFQKNSAQLPDSSIHILDGLASFMKKYPDLHLTISGHTDSEGDSIYNLELSEGRALLVRNKLIQKKCDSSRLHIRGLGEQLADTVSADAYARRVDFIFKEVRP